MQDRYTYRAKDIDTNKWVYGFYAELPYGLSSSGCMGEFSDVAPYILTCKTKQSSLFSNAEPHEVIVCETCKIDEKTLGQCTGLKDKNGKLIYEGDILKINEYKLPVEVKRNNLGFELYRKPTHLVGYHNDKYIPENCKVIGNVYENPELLESEQ